MLVVESLVSQPGSGVDSFVISHGGFGDLSHRRPARRQTAECWSVLDSRRVVLSPVADEGSTESCSCTLCLGLLLGRRTASLSILTLSSLKL